MSLDAIALAGIVVIVVLAHLPYMFGIVQANPLGFRSGLGYGQVAGYLGGASTLDINDGVISQALGHLAAHDWLHLQFPWWNPFAGTGYPLAGEMQSAAFFPPTLLTALGNGQLYEHMLLESLAGIATYLLLARLGLSRAAALLGGIAFALNGTFAWFSHATVNPVAFLPLLLLGLEHARAAALERRRGGWWLIAIAGAASFYAGFPETTYLDSLLALVWAGWRGAELARGPWRPFVLKAGAGAAAAALLCAPLLLALLTTVRHSDLELHSTSFLAGAHLSPEALPQLVFPYLYGPLIGFNVPAWGSIGGYLTSSLMLLAVAGLLAPGRRGLRVALGGWLVLVAARAYGQPPLLRGILGLLPGMSTVDFSRYVFPAVELPVIVLAAIGLDSLVHASRRRLIGAGGAAAGLALLAALGALPLVGRLGATFHRSFWLPGSLLWGGAVMVAIAAIALLARGRRRAVLIVAIVSLDVLVMFLLPELAAPRSVRIDQRPVAFMRGALGQGRYLSLGPIGPNYGSYFGLRSINLSDGVVPSRYARYVRARLNPVVAPTIFVGTSAAGILFLPTTPASLAARVDAYRAAGVGYVLVPPGPADRLPGGPFRLLASTPTADIYRLRGAAAYFDAPGCTLRSTSLTSVQAQCRVRSRLVRRETYMPGWTAAVDGRSAPIAPAGGLFQAVGLPPGRHRITFAYSPPGAWLGWLAGAAGLSWMIIAGARARRARRPATRSGRSEPLESVQ